MKPAVRAFPAWVSVLHSVSVWGAILCGFLLYLYGALLLVGQVLVWLSTDVWIALPARYLFVSPPPQVVAGITFRQDGVRLLDMLPDLGLGADQWLQEPTSWFGLHRLVTVGLDVVSVPVVYVGSGLLVFGWAVAMGLTMEDLPAPDQGIDI